MASRGTSLGPHDQFMLEQWGRQLKEAFGNRPYLVGSVMRGGACRDVDVRMVSPKRWLNQPNVRRAVNLSVSLWGRQVTGLPIDFQFQSPDEFAAETGIRSALGMMPAVWLNEGAKP